MWDSYSALKQMIEQKDEVINQLYNQLSDLQDKVTQSQSVQQTLFSGGFASSSYHSLKSKQSTKELQVIADREFYAADKVITIPFPIVYCIILYTPLGWRR
jgi:hypothetical protein